MRYAATPSSAHRDWCPYSPLDVSIITTWWPIARNLINDAAHREVAARMNRQLFGTLEATGGMYIPLAPDRGRIQNLRRRGASGAADFPPEVISPPRR